MFNYEQSGVSVKKADILTQILKKDVNSENIGMFAGLYENPAFPEYYLAGCTDGIGTKIIPLLKKDRIETISTDLVAMNLNDLVCVGAKPIFFLDYFATHNLDVNLTARFINALREELTKYNCALLGGETSEMGDIVKEGHFDVSGFAVGLVKKDRVLSKKNVKEGDVIIALKSSGAHANGFTLIRKLHKEELITEEEFNQTLEPTYIYANEILELCDKDLIHACANITGGGIEANLNRAIPDGFTANIDKNKIPTQPLFEKLSSLTGEEEAYKTFNMGVGMCIITSKTNADNVLEICNKYNPFLLGVIA